MAAELVRNGRFREGRTGALPAGWTMRSPRPTLAPRFAVATRAGRRVLSVRGNGRADCVGQIVAPVTLEGGGTYRLRARLAGTRGLEVHRSLVIGVFAKDFNNGIFSYAPAREGALDGESVFSIPGTGPLPAELRITFRGSAAGAAWIESVSLAPRGPIEPRPVRVAVTHGLGTTDEWSAALDAAGAQGVDLVLLPEMMNGTTRESMSGPSPRLMKAKAREHRTYVAGGIYFHDKAGDRLLNRMLLFDRAGKLVGTYDKVHPYTPEISDEGVTPGTEVPVFRTDFGIVGAMICYDSWFTDVAELLALRGAELVLFPNAGYYRSLMPARAADNGIRILASSLYDAPGVWDTAGRDVQAPDLDPTCNARQDGTFSDPRETTVGKIRLVTVTLDLSRSPSPHNWGGPLLSAPGGRRNRREQSTLLYAEIERETRRA